MGALLATGLQLLLLAREHAVNVLFSDQWDFGVALLEPHSLWERFNWQHGPIRQGLGNLVLSVVWGLSRWNVRAEAFSAVATFLLAAALALVLVRRFAGSLSPYDIAVPLLYVSPVSWELLAVTPNPAHGSLPLLLVTGFALALFIRSLPVRLVALLVIDFFSVFTGFGLFVGPLCLLVLLAGASDSWNHKGRAAAHVGGAIIALAVILFFLRGYHFQPAVDCFVFPWRRPWEYLPFMGFIEGQPLGLRPVSRAAIFLAAALGSALLLGALYATFEVWRHRLRWQLASTLFVLVSFSALFALNAAIGRICLGPGAAGASRYAPYAVPALLAAYLVIRTRLPPSFGRTAGLLFFVLLVSLPHFLTRPYIRQAHYFAAGKRRWVECYLDRHEVESCDRLAGFHVYPWPTATHLQEKLDWLEHNKLSFFAPGHSL